MRRPRVVVVGAGVAGLTAARDLRDAFDVVVVDKGRGVGGRLATRRIGDATFDHGAQFVTTHSAAFAAIVAGWEAHGAARPWHRGRVGPTGVEDPDGHPRFRGVPAMSAIAKHLATGLDIRLGTRVRAVEAVDGRWRLHVEAGSALDGDVLLLTAPVPQALALLNAGDVAIGSRDRDALQAITYDPCMAVLAPLRGPSGFAPPGAVDPADGPVDWVADNHLKGVSASPAVTVHATAAYSRSQWGAADAVVADELLSAVALGAEPVRDLVQVHRWRYAKPTVVHPERCLTVDRPAPLVCAGDAFGGAKVEGAALSGVAAAEVIRARWGGR